MAFFAAQLPTLGLFIVGTWLGFLLSLVFCVESSMCWHWGLWYGYMPAKVGLELGALQPGVGVGEVLSRSEVPISMARTLLCVWTGHCCPLVSGLMGPMVHFFNWLCPGDGSVTVTAL